MNQNTVLAFHSAIALLHCAKNGGVQIFQKASIHGRTQPCWHGRRKNASFSPLNLPLHYARQKLRLQHTNQKEGRAQEFDERQRLTD